MSKFKVGDIVSIRGEVSIAKYDLGGYWRVASFDSRSGMYALEQDGRRWESYPVMLDLVSRPQTFIAGLPAERSRMIFPFEEPEGNSPFGCPMVVDFADGRRSVGTLAGVGPVKYDGDDVVSYEVSYQPTRTFSTAITVTDVNEDVWRSLFGLDDPPKRVVHRASRGMRQPKQYENIFAKVRQSILGAADSYRPEPRHSFKGFHDPKPITRAGVREATASVRDMLERANVL